MPSNVAALMIRLRSVTGPSRAGSKIVASRGTCRAGLHASRRTRATQFVDIEARATGRTAFIRPTIWPTGIATTSGSPAASMRLVRLADQQVLQRHRQRVGRAVLGPGLGPLGLEQPRRLAAVDARAHGLVRAVAATSASLHRVAVPSVGTRRVVSQYEPIHTPPAPRASAAAIWRPEPMPPAARTGDVRADRVDDLGHAAPWWRSRRCGRRPRCPARR